MEFMGVLVIGFHSHCNDCDTMCVTETEHGEFSKYIFSLIKPQREGRWWGIELSDRTLVVHSRH